MAFSIVTGNGFAGNAQRCDDVWGDSFIYSTYQFTSGTFNLSFKYRSNVPMRVIFGDLSSPWDDIVVVDGNPGTAIYAAVNGINAASYVNYYLGFTSQTDLLNGTSSTSITIPTSHPTTVSFTTQTGLDFVAGLSIVMQASSWFRGTVTSYNPSNGAMVVSSTSNGGSGTFNSWSVYAESGVWFELDEVNLYQV